MTDRDNTSRSSTTQRDLRFAGTVAAGLVAGVLGVGAIAVPLFGWNDWPQALSASSGDPITMQAAKERSAPRRDSDASRSVSTTPRPTVTGPTAALALLTATSGSSAGSGTAGTAGTSGDSGAPAAGSAPATVRRARSGLESTGKGMRRSGQTRSRIDIAKAAEYSCEDSDQTLDVHRTLWPQLEANEKLRFVYQLEMDSSETLYMSLPDGEKLYDGFVPATFAEIPAEDLVVSGADPRDVELHE